MVDGGAPGLGGLEARLQGPGRAGLGHGPEAGVDPRSLGRGKCGRWQVAGGRYLGPVTGDRRQVSGGVKMCYKSSAW